jgi:uncharacterized membrane protein
VGEVLDSKTLPKVTKVLPDMSEENGNNFKFERHTGPLPHPNILKAYNEISPMLGEIIVDQFLKETSHRRDLENKEQDDFSRSLTAQIQAQTRGQQFGLASLTLIALFGLIIALTVHPIAGAGVITASAVTAAAVFVTGKASRRAIPEVIDESSQLPPSSDRS